MEYIPGGNLQRPKQTKKVKAEPRTIKYINHIWMNMNQTSKSNHLIKKFRRQPPWARAPWDWEEPNVIIIIFMPQLGTFEMRDWYFAWIWWDLCHLMNSPSGYVPACLIITLKAVLSSTQAPACLVLARLTLINSPDVLDS